MPNVVQSWIHEGIDWVGLSTRCRQWAPLGSGALFGGGWWCFIDAVVYSKAILGEKVPIVYWVPGVVATISLVLMNLVSRDRLNHAQEMSDHDDYDTKARCWLFMSYLVAFGSVGGAGAVFVKAVTNHNHVGLGVGVLLQAGFVLLSALVLWAFRTPSDEDYFMY